MSNVTALSFVCPGCDERHKSRRWSQVYCSTKCQNRVKYARRKSDVSRAKACQRCEESFIPSTSNQVYCGSSCSAKVSNVARTRVRPCQGCGVKNLTWGQKKYCSNACIGAAQTRRMVDAWLAGTLSGSTKGGTLRRSIRAWLVEQAGNKCEECGWGTPNPVLGRPILTVDHIDGNWKNNTRENLKVLCYNCHTLTPTFGALNRGSVSGCKHTALKAR